MSSYETKFNINNKEWVVVNRPIGQSTNRSISPLGSGQSVLKVVVNRPPTKERKKYIQKKDTVASQKALLVSFPLDTQPLVTEYVECAKNENQTKTITEGRKLRLINELFNVFHTCDPKQFSRALTITNDNEVANINYLKKVIKNLDKKKAVGYKLGEQQREKGYLEARAKTKEIIKRTREETEEMQKW